MNKTVLAVAGVMALGVATVAAIWLLKFQPETSPKETPEELVGASGRQMYTLEVDGIDREFVVYRPEDVPLTEELPVVFMFHGGGGGGPNAAKDTGWIEKAEAEGFMAVFPTALKYHVFAESKVKNGRVVEDLAEYATRWTGENIDQKLDPEYPDQVVYDDVVFVRSMLDFLDENYAIDTDRVYASGFSNGSGFLNTLMLQATDIFAAFGGSSSGGLSVETLQTAGYYKPDNFVPRPTMVSLGSKDPKLTYASTIMTGTPITEFATDESAVDEGYTLRTRYVDAYLEILGLTDDYRYENDGETSHFTFKTLESGASTDLEFHFYVIDGMKHTYPNGNNFPFVATDLYWPFFEQYSL